VYGTGKGWCPVMDIYDDDDDDNKNDNDDSDDDNNNRRMDLEASRS
jgi:hypothetical protein